tara:strand:- start:694 stop:864 length:171 start_codon:yes stop_codon:yes gene_type:complete
MGRPSLPQLTGIWGRIDHLSVTFPTKTAGIILLISSTILIKLNLLLKTTHKLKSAG